jgi:hypothetical protein
MTAPSVYLGNGIHVEFDGSNYRLWTKKDNRVHEIVVGPIALATLLHFINRTRNNKENS